MTNFYGEPIPLKSAPPSPLKPNMLQDQSIEPKRIIVEVDMNEPNTTLYRTIQKTKAKIDEIPDDIPVTIYLVNGSKENTYEFWNQYFEYLNTIPNLERLNIIYRGFIHYENLGFFFLNCPVILSNSCELIYDSRRLFDIMKLLSTNQSTYQKFTSRFLGFYKNFTYIVIEDLTELNILGLNFQVF